MHFCFILEEEYRNSRLPMVVVAQLAEWGHESTVLEPCSAVADVDELLCRRDFSAIVLRTVSSGPGLSLLHALGAAGATTINDADAVRRVRDKVVVAALASAHGIAAPQTWFVADVRLLESIPAERYPLVVKPSVGGFGRSVRLLQSREELSSLDADGFGGGYLIAQPWVANSGHDVKLYNTGQAIHAVRRRSSLLGGADSDREQISVTDELRDLAGLIGRAFALEIYGADLVEGERGWVVVDVNDFPSFGRIASAPQEVAATILEIARRQGAPESAR
jgi:ribosomal protein S6--L-glutamate ligase